MWAIDMVFVVGGNGGNAGANAIQRECARCGVTCSVIGVPKSIDNDILLVRGLFWPLRRARTLPAKPDLLRTVAT